MSNIFLIFALMKKICSRCKVDKPLNEFGVDKTNKDGHRYHCKVCRTAVDRKRYHDNPETVIERNLKKKDWRKAYYDSDRGVEVSRRAHLKSTYGITLEEYQEMAEKQDGVCAICGKEDKNYRNKILSVDHNHDTGEVRGLLCGLCNLGMGGLKDSIDLLKKAIKYLENYEKLNEIA